MPDTSVSPYIPLVPFKLPPQCWSSEGASLSRWVRVWVLQEELLRAPAASSTNLILAGFLSQKLWGLTFLALESWAGWTGVGLGLLAPEISLPNFYPQGFGASLFWVHTSPTCLDGCGCQFHSCQASIQLDFWCSWVIVVLCFICNFDVVVWRG